MVLRRGFVGLLVMSAIACGGSGFGDIDPEPEQASATGPVVTSTEDDPASPEPAPASPPSVPSSPPSAPAPDGGAPATSDAGQPWPGPFDGGWIPPLGLDGGIPWLDGGLPGSKDAGKREAGLGILDGGLGIFDGGLLPF